ncbi:uncharacterized protein M421DRAFT_2482 [Didymella exigua CBS 183.55]|uniref:BRCT domain-containing protein n=1 Tax=Didymella exigua CBS 183.55 TaxID=1150837 RepID=A0A6A5RXB6_9PLEO|nr:uncharacterized protein M421DRAFT_2482 [Didymella exigua CBS 183.55]KAF1931864.1 hypothetical protein M421DRAFT_2482 [Didymella exigua CBS 183.55]
MSTPGPDNGLKPTRDDDHHFAPPSSAQVCTSKPVTKPDMLASPTAAAPARRTFFGPWNSSSTGHQHAENRLSGSISWRASRSLKLREQYKDGIGGGGMRVADTVGAGSEDFGKGGRKENGGWEKGANGLRTSSQKNLADVWSVSKAGKKTPSEEKPLQVEQDLSEAQDVESDAYDGTLMSPSAPQAKQLFNGLCFCLNGSTAPLVSDHRLKHMLSAHGAHHSIALGRRTVTHVVLGTVNANGGCGGGLAATKIQKEVARTGGKAVKVLESIKAGRRLPESRFAPLKLAQKTQGSVLSMIRSSDTTKTAHK